MHLLSDVRSQTFYQAISSSLASGSSHQKKSDAEQELVRERDVLHKRTSWMTSYLDRQDKTKTKSFMYCMSAMSGDRASFSACKRSVLLKWKCSSSLPSPAISTECGQCRESSLIDWPETVVIWSGNSIFFKLNHQSLRRGFEAFTTIASLTLGSRYKCH